MDRRNIYKEGKELAEAIVAVMSEKSDDQQSDKIKLWGAANRFSEDSIGRLTNEDSIRTLVDELNVNRDSETQRMLNDIKRKSIRSLRARVIASAVAVAVGCYVALNVFDNGGDTAINNESAVVNTVHPTNDNVPYLIINGGSRVTLNESRTIAEAGATTTEAKIDYSTIKDKNSTEEVITNLLVVPKQQTYTVMLSDGTDVYINGDSKLEYPSVFSSDKREVRLTGEAYFDIAKSDKTFVVHTKHTKTIAYGTAFNVNAYNEKQVISSLVRGVAGANIEGFGEITMSPGVQLHFDVDSGNVTQQKFNINKYEAWRDGFFWCDGDEIVTILDDISRWYDVQFSYESEETKTRKLIASISMHEPIEKVIEIIESVSSINFEKKGGNVYIVK